MNTKETKNDLYVNIFTNYIFNIPTVYSILNGQYNIKTAMCGLSEEP